MQWEGLVALIVPLVTACVALLNTGFRRWVAIVATLASAGLYLPGLYPPLYELMPRLLLGAIAAVTLIAILTLLAGKLRHPSQFLALAIGALGVAVFFATPALPTEFQSAAFLQATTAFLQAGVAVMLGVPRIIGFYLERRAERAEGRGARWHPMQWAALCVGTMMFLGALIFIRDKDTWAAVGGVGLIIAAGGSRLIGFIVQARARGIAPLP